MPVQIAFGTHAFTPHAWVALSQQTDPQQVSVSWKQVAPTPQLFLQTPGSPTQVWNGEQHTPAGPPHLSAEP